MRTAYRPESIVRHIIADHCARLHKHRRRFDRLAGTVADWADRWSTDALARRLHEAHTAQIRRRALVALALQASDASGAVIDAYSPQHRDVDELFHRAVHIEWHRRHADAATARAA